MNLLWIEDFPLFLPKEDGSEGDLQCESETLLFETGLHETAVAEY